MLNQKEMCRYFDALKYCAHPYQKQGTVLAYPAGENELIKTVTSDGLETTNTAKNGDIVVVANTTAMEKYLLSWTKFTKKYVPTGHNIDYCWEFQAVGNIYAIEVNEAIHSIIGKEFMAAWGQPMKLSIGDFLACPVDELDGIDYEVTEVYRIARDEFFQTYKQADL